MAEHLNELRLRLMVVIAVLIGSSLLGYLLHERLLHILLSPLDAPLYYQTPGGGFSLLIQISLVFGLLLTTPVALYQILRFVEPALPEHSERWILAILVASLVLATAGAALALGVSLPLALHFLGEFGNGAVQPLIQADAYMSFVLTFVGGFALLFQLPLVLLVINQLHDLSPRMLLGRLRWVILGAFVGAAILTPTPDMVSQSLLALPIIGLYLLGIALVAAMAHSAKRLPRCDQRAKAVLSSLGNRKLEATWEGGFEGHWGKYFRWSGLYQDQPRQVTTFVAHKRHQIVRALSDPHPSI